MDNKTGFAERFVDDVSMFRACEQCGRCSSACPVTGLEGFNIRRILRHVEFDLTDEVVDSPLPWLCTTCGRCEEACPNGIEILDIIRIMRQLSPPEWAPEGPPCTIACPAGVDVPGYLRFVAQGKVNEAYALIREKVPFPGILGRVCPHPCEDACRRRDVFNQPIAICALKRYVADNAGDISERVSRVGGDTGRTVAIVGAGPAGLTAAFYLRKKGHRVTVFEERSEPGGMMRFGIPDYRLPRDLVDKEIKAILDLGIELRAERKLGRDFDVDQLRADGYDALFLAVGAQLTRKMDLQGTDLDGVFWGLDFLCEVNEGKEIALKDRVLVVGGGNVAVDVALTALRLGAKEVTMVSLERREEMPANPWEVEMALEEGVTLMNSWGPSKVIGDSGKVSGVELVRCTSVFDEEGNFCPTFAGIRETVRTDQVILAIGQAPDLSFVNDKGSLRVEEGLVVIDQETQEMDIPGVFAGGDVATAPGTIIDAIAAGRRAASSIDRFLGGDGSIEETFVEMPPAEPAMERREKGFADLKREQMPCIPLPERHDGFPEVELGLNHDQAVREAKRCLNCDLQLRLAQDARAGTGT